MSGVPRRQVDTSHSSPARIYSAYQGRKDGYSVDRSAADEVGAYLGAVDWIAASNRAFRDRAVLHAAEGLGLRQFLDIGTGMPQDPNTHEIVQAVDPSSRVVYVDNDPIVLRHAEALLQGDPRGVTAYVDADVRDPQPVLDQAAQTLDFSRPVAVVLAAVLHFIGDDDNPQDIVESLMAPLAPGSCLILSHATDAFAPDTLRAVEALLREQNMTVRARDRREITGLFDGLTLLPPGVTEIHQWRPPSSERPPQDYSHCLAAVGVKPS